MRGLGKRGDEAASARHLVHLYKRWCFAMFPALAFEDVLLRVQKLSSKERVRVKVDEFKRRQAYADYERRFPGAAAKRKADADEAAAKPGAGLTEEQRQMIAKKKAEALAKRQRVEAPAAAADEFPDEFPDDDEWMGDNAADEEALDEAEREMMGGDTPLARDAGPVQVGDERIVADDDDDDAFLAAMDAALPAQQPTPATAGRHCLTTTKSRRARGAHACAPRRGRCGGRGRRRAGVRRRPSRTAVAARSEQRPSA